jgi:hypothetical protein
MKWEKIRTSDESEQQWTYGLVDGDHSGLVEEVLLVIKGKKGETKGCQ